MTLDKESLHGSLDYLFIDPSNVFWNETLYELVGYFLPADSKTHGNHHPEYDEVPVLAAQAHHEAGEGEGECPSGQENSPGQVLVQEVREDCQQHRGEDEHLDEGRTGQNLKLRYFDDQLFSGDS